MDYSDAFYSMCYEAFPEDRGDGTVFKTQDQLQEMVKADIGELFSMFVRFCGGIREGEVWLRLQYCDYSMEQLWLAFVMKEKYNKTWDKGQWCDKEDE